MRQWMAVAMVILSGVVASAATIAGKYAVQGTNPGGKGTYRGTAVITPSGDTYKMHWEVGTPYDGVGTLNGNVFDVKWGKNLDSTVTYVVGADGVLKGTWSVAGNTKNIGTEVLTPLK